MKKVYLLLVVMIIGVIGVLGFVLLTDSGDNTSPQSTMVESDTQEIEINSDVFISDYFGSYQIQDTGFGTSVAVDVDAAVGTRTIVSNALPNHETGEFPNDGNPNSISEQDAMYTYPLNPVFIGNATTARVPGVAVNGIKFEPGTAERATCSNGEAYAIEAIQDFTDLGLDFNNAHVQPSGEYHYHGVPDMLVGAFSGDNDLVHVGFAADGHMMYYSKSSVYTSGYKLGEGQRSGTNCTYSNPVAGSESLGAIKDGTVTSDWVFSQAGSDLDECNGTTIAGQYVYILTESYPYIPRCLMGQFTEAAPSGVPPTGTNQGGPPPPGAN